MFSIQGKVSAADSDGQGAAGLTILALDTLDGAPTIATTATPSKDGAYTLVLELGDVLKLFRGNPDTETRVLERSATLHISVLRGGMTLAREEVSFTIRDLLDGMRCIDFSVELGRAVGERSRYATAARGGCRYFVRGHLLRQDGTAMPSTRVEVVEKRLRSEVVLSETATDHEGAYAVVYGGPAPCDPARPGKSVFARAFDAHAQEIARSRLHCDVPAEVTIDLVVGEAEAEVLGPSLYNQVWQAVEPHLEQAQLHELNADDVEFLACTTREDVVQVAYLVRAAQLERATRATQVAFFALFNAGLPTTLVGILGQDRETLEAALKQGATDNVVPRWPEGQIESILDALQEARLELSVPEANPGASLLGQLLLTGDIATSLPRQFIEAWLSRSGTVPEFWEEFRTEHGATVTARVQFTLAVGSLTGNHIPLVKVLQAKRDAEEIERARELARLTVADWLDVLTTGAEPPVAPSAIPGETQGEKNERYAATLQRVFEDAFPTVAVAGALARADRLENVGEFVKLNETFDFGRTRIDAFLNDDPNLPTGDLEELRRDLKHVQRLHAISPRFGRGEAVTALLGKNVFSAQQLYKMGYAGFMQKFEGVLEEPERELAWRKAAQQSYKVLAAVANHAVPFNAPRPAVLAYHVGDPAEDGFPNIETLFGTQDFCTCEHCRSVFSPAAYLTDLLKFLRDQPAAPEGPFETLLDVIKDRRPDLVHILLNCANANTAMPSIDLVNEILERRVSPPQGSDGEDLQTAWTVQELRAHPEHLHQPAYDVLKDAVHPFILPFDLRLEEARLYLDHLGVRLADLLHAFRGHSEQAQDVQALARERLRLSTMQGEIIEDDFSDTSPAPGDLWGLGGSWVNDLNVNDSPVRRFLKQASLAYQELLELLQVDYVCLLAGTVEIEHAEGKPCTLEDAVFGPSAPSPGGWAQHGLGETRLRRAQRFIRLARRTGWSFFDLDAAVRALGTVSNPYQEDALDGAWVRRFAGVVRLLERWPRLSKLEVLSWFGLLDTHRGPEGKPSFYQRLFLDRTLDLENERFVLADSDPGDPPDDPPAVPELATTGPLDLAIDGPVLQAALNLREEEIEALLEALEAFAEQVPQRNLTWLSRLHRRASLSRALGMRVLDLMRLASLMGVEPFADDVVPEPGVEHTRKFIERVERVRATRFTLAELDYLLRHRFEPSEGVALLRDRKQEIFVELIRGLQDIEAETSREGDAATPALTVLGDRLGQVIGEALIEATLQLIQRDEGLDVENATLRAEFEKFLSEEDIDRLFEEDSQGQPVQDGRTVEERSEDTLALLLEHIRSTQMEALVIQKLSDAVGLDSGAGEALLRKIDVNSEGGVTLFLRNAFVHAINFKEDAEAIKKEGFPALDPAIVLDEHFETLERLYKASMVVQRFGFRVRNVEWLLEHADALELLDPLGLPPPEMEETTAVERFERWEKLARVVLLRDTVFRKPDALFDLLSTADDENGHLHEDGQALLVEGTGWDAADLKHLVEHEEDTLDINADSIKSIDGLERLARAFAILRRLGVAANRATGWATTDVPPEVAQAIKNTTRSKHAPEQWPQVIGPLRDSLREQQRDALVAQVLAQSPHLREPDDILGKLLIDVQGAACQRTSRIVQASASVQLFVQRLLMDLESPERLDDRAAREWVWRKFYRVWEANRKVFLYPENFLEPELRDDQSPFFRELAADLLDADLTPERAERAYVQYLRKVKEVARLQVAGIYHEVEYGYRAGEMMPYQVINDLHVFARTMSPPYRYFYRKWVKETYWTAWEEVPLGIEHPTVMPAVHHRRLLLMWPTFMEVAEGKKGSDTPLRYLEIQLAFSEYVDGAWTQTQLSEEKTSTVRPRFEITTARSARLVAEGITRNTQAIFFETLVGERDLLVQPMFVATARLLVGDPTGGVVQGRSLNAYVPTPQAFHFLGAENKVFTLESADDIRFTSWPSAHPRPNRSGIRHQYYASLRKEFDDPSITRAFSLYRPYLFDTKGAEVVATPPLLVAASPFEVLAPRHNVQGFPFGTERTPGRGVRFLADDPFFYHDDRRTFFVWPRDPNELGLPSFEGDDADLADLNSDNIGPSVFKPGPPVYSDPTTAPGGVLDDPSDQGAEHDYAASQARSKRFWFFSFQHPFITRMLGIVEREGVAGLLDPAEDGDNADLRRQLKSELVMRQVPGEYEPNNELVKVKAKDEFEFEAWGAYALYNWEIFFHAPLLVAQRLRDAQRFEDAQRWYHSVFDPTESSSDDAVQRFWKVKPLYEATQPKSITERLEALNYTGGDPEKQLLRHTTEGQIAQWRENPFNPHLLARMRPAAYQRATVMKYLDNLIAWGDHLFQRATRETIGEALQIYVLASQILGRRPLQLNARTPHDRSFDELEEHLDAFSNALVELENLLPPGNQWDWLGLDGKLLTAKIQHGVQQPGGGVVLNFAVPPPEAPLNKLKALGDAGLQPDVLLMNLALAGGSPEVGREPERALYYCVPPNAKLLAYWDTVEDRLFKIRNCLDIEGVRLELPLFQPPIDPALLVKAAAAGIDLASAIAALNAPRPHYRFRTMIPLAKELAAEVRALGQALLTALERKDAEELAELRATHEVRTVEMAERVFEERVSEARQTIIALEAAQAVAEHRKSHFAILLQEPLLETEEVGLFWSQRAEESYSGAIGKEKLAAERAQIPDFGISIGFPGVSVSTTIGGSLLSIQRASDARISTHDAAEFGVRSSALLTTAGIEVRQTQWELEFGQAEKEIERIEKEIIPAQIRLDIAQKELENHRQEIAQARERENFLKHRFTRSELYGWMASEVGRVYHQAYQLAYDVAKRAERTYQFELAAEGTSFIQFGYWDNQRKGLLAGDKLLHDIRRMETAYLQSHRREFELTKSVSLATLDPVALVLLREIGECYVRVPELLFDLDHPGHFLRRLKSVSVSVASKTGQLAEVPLTLTLVSSAIRKSASTDPEALVDDLTSGAQQIATLSAEEDDGLFERNFNDERYLPFEGRGAVGLWHIELPKAYRQFDYGLIGDVVLRLSFIARQGGDIFKAAVQEGIDDAIEAYVRHESSFGQGLTNAVSVRKVFPDDWNRFIDPAGEEDATLELDFSPERFPLKFHGGEIRVSTLWLLAVFRDQASTQTLAFDLELPSAPDGSSSITIQNLQLASPLSLDAARIRMAQAAPSPLPSPQPTTGAWTLELLGVIEVPEALEDLVIVPQYTVLEPT